MDYHFEQSVCNNYPNRHKKKLIILKIMKWVFAVLGVMFLFFALFTPVSDDAPKGEIFFLMGSMFLFSVLFFFGSFFINRFVRNVNPEFDYSVSGGNLLIIKVINKEKRKKFKTYKLETFQEIGKAESESFERHASQNEVKKVYAIANPEDIESVYYALINDAGEKSLLLFEPSQELIITVTRTLSRNIFADKKGYRY